jgi:hypothetical protein
VKAWFVALVLLALVAPPSAGAHIRSDAVAVDYRARVLAVPASLAVRIYESDRAVRLTVAPGHSAVVLGYLGEPFVRITAAGVEVNASAPTTGAAALTVAHSAGWQRLSESRSVTWHDNRVRALPAGIDRARWQIPLLVDGRPATLQGELWRVRAPAWWPWLLTGLPFLLVSLLVFFRRRPAVSSAAAAFGLLAAAGLVASGAGLAFDTYASTGKWIALGNELALAVAGAAVIAIGTRLARGLAGGALGLLGLAAVALTFPVLLHGVVLSVFPATVARTVLVLTLWSAVAATAFGLVVFEDELASAQLGEPLRDGLRVR